MSTSPIAYVGARIFHKARLIENHALVLEDGYVTAILPETELTANIVRERLDGGVIAPGFVDLQVNGGGGVMFNTDTTVEALRTMSAAHASIGATSIMPTLISDSNEKTVGAIDAVAAAMKAEVPGIIGLHLEGPHLSLERKGAHDAAFIRPMQDADVALLLNAAGAIPALKVTVALENVTNEQINQLSKAGIIVSIGHTNATFEACKAAADAGAKCVTHLFNAQSQMGNREPGTVGAALSIGSLSAGVIADGIHVHEASLANALRAKSGPGDIFFVSDAMATAGTDLGEFTLNGRTIERHGNRLTLKDGTLAGAHLEIAQAIKLAVENCQDTLGKALARATILPAKLIGHENLGDICVGAPARAVYLDESLNLKRTWKSNFLHHS